MSGEQMLEKSAGSLEAAPLAWPERLRNLAPLIAEADLVSFDFFDTLFVRPLVDPEDAFDVLCETRGIEAFRARRRAAQSRAFQVMIQNRRGEIDIDGIYECFDDLPNPDAVRNAEFDLEHAVTLPNPEMVAVFLAAIKMGKTVVVTSDMYLPRHWFSALMQRHGLPDVPLFISADRNATKRDQGELFGILSAETDVPNHRILHIGDNAESDVAKARDRGIVAFHYDEPRLPPRRKGISPAASLARGLIRAHQSEVPPGSLHELGFMKGGPAALGFLDWISEEARQDGIDHLLFVSRDGYVLNALARRQPERLPPFSYLLGSRVAFALAATSTANFDTCLPFLVSGSDGLTPAEVLARIGVTAPAERVLQALGLGEDVSLRSDAIEPMLGLLQALRWDILKVCRRNRRGLFRHLLQLGVKPGQHVAMVDVGWNGTTQQTFVEALQDLMPLTVTGYYFCLNDSEDSRRRSASMSMKAMVNAQSVPADMLGAIYANRVAVELFFSAPHDAVIGYADGPGGVVAVQDPGRAAAGNPAAVARQLERGIQDFAESYRQWQDRLQLRRPDPLGLAMPLLEFVADGGWADHPELRSVKNFDAWASSSNRDMWLSDYAGRGWKVAP